MKKNGRNVIISIILLKLFHHIISPKRKKAIARFQLRPWFRVKNVNVIIQGKFALFRKKKWTNNYSIKAKRCAHSFYYISSSRFISEQRISNLYGCPGIWNNFNRYWVCMYVFLPRFLKPLLPRRPSKYQSGFYTLSVPLSLGKLSYIRLPFGSDGNTGY